MLQRTRLIVAIGLAVLATGMVLAVVGRKRGSEQMPVNIVNVGERRIVEIDETIISRTNPLDSLARPVKMIVANGHVFIADQYDRRIKAFTLDGDYEYAIGNGTGDGPGELSNIVDFCIGGDMLAIVDNRSRRVALFSLIGESLGRFATDAEPLRCVVVADHVALFSPLRDSLYTIHDRTGHIVSEFDGNLPDDEFSGFSLDGQMTASDEEVNPAFFVGLRLSSYLLKYDLFGRLLRSVQTIDAIAYSPPLVRGMDGGGTQVVPASGEMWVRGISTDGPHVYLVVNDRLEAAPLGKRFLLDVYSVNTGLYEMSIETGIDSRHMFVSNGMIYILDERLGLAAVPLPGSE